MNNIEWVNAIEYLGSYITEDNEVEEDIKRRIMAGNRCYGTSTKFSKKGGSQMPLN